MEKGCGLNWPRVIISEPYFIIWNCFVNYISICVACLGVGNSLTIPTVKTKAEIGTIKCQN